MRSTDGTEALGAYGGVSGADRRARRRELLLAAALEVFGTRGYAKSSVKSICDQAGLTERYFYESFEDREDILFAVYEQVAGETLQSAFAAAEAADATVESRARAGLGAFFGLLTGDERKARVLSFEVVGVSDRLERRRRETIHAFAEYLAVVGVETAGEGRTPGLDPWLTALSMVGGINELLIEWVLGNLEVSLEQVVEHSTQLLVTVAEAAYSR